MTATIVTWRWNLFLDFSRAFNTVFQQSTWGWRSVDMALLLLTVVACAGAASSPPPNIVLIVADDLGWADVPWHDPSIYAPRCRHC